MDNNLSTVYKKAAQNAPVLGSLLQKVANQTGARPLSNFKNPQTAVDKVEEKNDEKPGRNYQLKDVNDIARGRLVYSSYDALKKGVDVLKDRAKQAGVTVSKEQNYFTKPQEGYRGYHVDLAFPNGQHEEVQLHTPQSYANALATHKLHEQYGKDAPPVVDDQTEKIGNQIMSLPPQDANQISSAVEAQNAPQQAQAQQMAKAVIQSPPPQQQPIQAQNPSQGQPTDMTSMMGQGPNAAVAQSLPSSMGTPQVPPQAQPTPQAAIAPSIQQAPSLVAFPPSQGGQGMTKGPATPQMLQKAVNYLKGNLKPEDIKVISDFATKVETGKSKQNLGNVGKSMQAMTEDVFGRKAANWTNGEIKAAWDQVLSGGAY